MIGRSPNAGLDDARRGWIFAPIGERERALAALERSLDRRAPAGLGVDRLESVRVAGEPRYLALLRRIGYSVDGTR